MNFYYTEPGRARTFLPQIFHIYVISIFLLQRTGYFTHHFIFIKNIFLIEKKKKKKQRKYFFALNVLLVIEKGCGCRNHSGIPLKRRKLEVPER